LIFDRYNYENISYGKLDSSREELEKVLKMCKLENKSEDSYIYLSGKTENIYC
jgi:hypothetical protein